MQSKIKEHIVNDPNSEDLSLAEQVFHALQIHSTGFHPGFFTHSDLSALALTSKTLKLVVSPELNMRAAEKLLTHVVLGEQTEAEAMIKANPNLLLIQSIAIDYSGRTIIATPFQAAL
ncbi:MAG: hypothetical protein Q8L68_00720, partial [Methylococcales bacterium]|nr:hypothetical protein [Methylococcales bacterium]